MVKRTKTTKGKRADGLNPQRSTDQLLDASRKLQRAGKTKKPGGLAALPRSRPDDAIPLDEIDPHEPLNVTMARLAARRPPTMPPRIPPSIRSYRVGGGALQDPGDKREARFAMRLHENLLAELHRSARRRGWKVSQFIEKIAVEAVNADNDAPIVDRIGRYLKKDR